MVTDVLTKGTDLLVAGDVAARGPGVRRPSRTTARSSCRA